MAHHHETKQVCFNEATRAWAKIGLLSFGGPTAQIALMHRIVVEQKKWLSEAQFLNALSFCMLLPGPEAMQLGTYVGWRLHGWRGGMTAGLLFIIPGAVVVLVLAMIYASFGNISWVESLFWGVKAAVVVIVIEALLRVSKKALKGAEHWLLALVSFISIFFLALPFPLIILLAATYGFLRFQSHLDNSLVNKSHPPFFQTIKTLTFWLTLWLLPQFLLMWALGPDQILSDIGWFFSKLAIVTFGGAYAVLAYMGQDVVVTHGWLSAGQMMDGLGLAETTPGPLILVTEFVGYLAAFQEGGHHSWVMGIYGAIVAIWVTFIPCFMWIFSGAPYIEWINHQPRLKGALVGITAAVVGVILNLSVWFGLHVFFTRVELHKFGWLMLWTPDVLSLDWPVVGLTLACAYLLLKRHWGIAPVLAASAGLALVLQVMA